MSRQFKHAIIFDLDNCLSNDEHRIPRIDWTKTGDARYHEYHMAMLADKPANWDVFENAMTRPVYIVFMTARPITFRETTKRWLSEQLGANLDLDDRFVLIMRNRGDHRKSVAVKRDMIHALPEYGLSIDNIIQAYDDRQDIVDMYRSEFGIKADILKAHEICAFTPPQETALSFQGDSLTAQPYPPATPAAQRMAPHEIMQSMAATFKERNAVYGDNFRMVAKIMKVLFPKDIPQGLAFQDHFHLFELLVVKLSRFATSNLSHRDSIHDAAVYCAMIESILTETQCGADVQN